MDNTNTANASQPWEAFALKENGDKTFWTRVGAAFRNRDGSYTLLLDAVPLSGKVQIRPQRPREDQADA